MSDINPDLVDAVPDPPAAMTSQTTILAVVVLLGIISLVGLGGLIYLAGTNAPADTLIAIGSPTTTALGALAAVLASTSSRAR